MRGRDPEARRLVAAKVEELRRLPYPELRSRLPTVKWRVLGGLVTVDEGGEQRAREWIDVAGERYELEWHVLWDDEDAGHVRVSVCAWRGGFRPRAEDDFIVAPDGSFVDEP